MSRELEEAMDKYELTEHERDVVRPLAERWDSFRKNSFLLMIKQQKLGTFRANSKKASKVGLVLAVGCSNHRKQSSKLTLHRSLLSGSARNQHARRRQHFQAGYRLKVVGGRRGLVNSVSLLVVSLVENGR